MIAGRSHGQQPHLPCDWGHGHPTASDADWAVKKSRAWWAVTPPRGPGGGLGRVCTGSPSGAPRSPQARQPGRPPVSPGVGRLHAPQATKRSACSQRAVEGRVQGRVRRGSGTASRVSATETGGYDRSLPTCSVPSWPPVLFLQGSTTGNGTRFRVSTGEQSPLPWTQETAAALGGSVTSMGDRP